MKRELGALVLSLFMSGCPADNSKIDASNYSASALNYSAPTRPDDSNVGKTKLLDLSTPEKAYDLAVKFALTDDSRFKDVLAPKLWRSRHFMRKQLRKVYRHTATIKVETDKRNGLVVRCYNKEGRRKATVPIEKFSLNGKTAYRVTR